MSRFSEEELERIKMEIENFIRKEVDSAGAEGVVIGVSGGVDSATVAILSAEAIGSDKVLGLIMPESGVTENRDIVDAKEVCRKAGIKYIEIDISSIVDSFLEAVGSDGKSKIAIANLKPRIRMMLNYYHANSLNRIVAGTGNKSELMVGYFTKYGDGGCDILPIGDLYKTEVYELAKHIGVPESILKKKPSAGLWKGQTDEGEMGVTYRELDRVLSEIEKGLSTMEIAEKTGIDEDVVKKVFYMVETSEHKRKMPPVASIRHLIKT
mgnify:CR=1 FL=1|jgi:NAD+ synthase